MLTFGEYTNSTTHLLTRRNKTSICLSNDYWFDLLEIDNDGFISSIQWSRHGTTNALHLLSIQTLLLPSPLNFTTNTGYANHSPTTPIKIVLPTQISSIDPWGTAIIHWLMPLLSTIRLPLPLKLQQRAHVACSIKCTIDLADRSMIKM